MIVRHLRQRLLPAALSAAFSIAAVGLTVAAAQAQDQAQMPAPAQNEALAKRVDAQMEQLLGKYPIPGASIAIAYKGEFVYQRGYGLAVIETNTPATPATRFRIASIAKPVTAVAILKLFEDELPQALDRKVFGPDGLLPDSAYPEFANPRDTRVLNVTLRDLLQHTGGWGATDYDPQYDLVDIARTMNVKAPASARDVIAFMLKQRSLDVPPGTEVHYSNFGYNILGRIIEYKTGKPYEQAVQDLVFKPAGVTDAVIGADKRAQRVANESAYYDDQRWPAVPDQDGSGATGPESYFGFHLATMDAHGGWVASAADLVRFVDAAQGTAKSPALLKPQTVALMKQRNAAMPDNNNGLGWVVTRMDGVTILSHSGALTTGSYGYLQAREDGWSWAVLFNRLPIPYPPEKAMADLQAFQTAVQRGLMAAIVNKTDPAVGK
ncbi:beta-lactamase family protein [Herbaspirillum sp. LeCh32-8]|uniref:serine hydrolase domain-containing protein n=1 Tax=Herbaspirillum sp. LeCh32-8 TaxID=2821356 RepID=UPI001AEA259F|nr:serine hydrolase domain-containing protein [Herbaspirillum sp. LeCh32-8]MBP0597127.1 beta-lactamase family protein [Herbaspirillum sp. LeCh32-8]